MKIKSILLAAAFLAVSNTIRAEWKDVTNYYIQNASFDSNKTTGWSWNSDASSQTANYGCFEFWNGYFEFFQYLGILPKGNYRLSMQGYYRTGDNTAVYQDYQRQNEHINAFLRMGYADNSELIYGKMETVAEKPLLSIYSFFFGQNIQGTWSPDGEHYFPDNMLTASLAFETGEYVNTLEFEVTEEREVIIQVACPEDGWQYSNWCIFDNFKLEYDGSLTIATGIDMHLANNEILVGQSTYGSYTLTPESVTSKIVEWSSSNPQVAAVDEYGTVRGLMPGTATITATTTDGSNLSASAVITVKSDDDLNWIDVTDVFVTNPSFDDNRTDGWDWYSSASSQTANFGCFEFWNGYFDFRQEVKGLIPGLYRVKMQGFYRTTDNGPAYEEYLNGSESIDTYLHVFSDKDAASVPLKSVYSFSFDDYTNNCWSPSRWGGPYFPNGMESASAAFEKGAYENKVLISVDSTLSIGIYNDSYTYSNWCIFDNFRLEYNGEIVYVNDINLSIDKTEIIESETTQVTAVVLPENALKKRLTWTSSNPRVAKVDENGLVTGVSVGVVTITATATDGSGVSASVQVRVVKEEISGDAFVINEIMASNVDEFVSPAYNLDGWVELYNPTDQPARLARMYMSDDPNNLTLWHMPEDMPVIPAKGYTVVWFDSNIIKTTQATFKLDTDGGTIYLSDENGKLITSQTYPASMERVSYARRQDGTGEWAFCASATPGKSNNNAPFAKTQISAPVVDQPSQLFTAPLSVNVTIPAGTTLRYTTDGTLPTMDNGSTSTTGQFAVSQTANYRFRLFADDMIPSVVTTRSYIYKNNDYTLPIVSVVGDPKFLYSDSMGVMVRGKNGRPGNGQESKCNWNMDWERPVNFSYITTDGEMVLNQDVNLEMCGGWSRAWNPKAFKLKGSKELGGEKNLPYPFFDDKPYIRNRTLQIRNGGNDYVCRFRDPALQQLVISSGIDIDCQAYQPVHEFVNGQYMGVLNVREPNNKHYVYANYGWDDDEIDQFEMSPDSGYIQKCGSAQVFNELVDYLSADAANSETYQEICRLLDIDEYINYMAFEMYICNYDWPQNNVKGFRKTEDGKFRFVLFDVDNSFGQDNPFTLFLAKETYQFDPLYPRSLPRITDQIRFVTLFRNLLANADFRKKFIDTYCIIGGSVLEANRSIAMIDELADRVNPAMAIEGGSVNSTASGLRNSLRGQMARATQSIRNFSAFDLYGVEPQQVNLNSDVTGAQLLINGMQVPTGEFHGNLFAPITLKAVAPAGYAFQGWVMGSGTEVTLKAAGSDWTYYDQGSLDGTNWTSPSYDISRWKTGKAPLGYGKNEVATTLDYGGNANDKRPTAYFRSSVNFSKKPSTSDIITLNFTIDDGFIVYVNGKEAGRYNMPSGNVSYSTFASSYAPNNPDNGTFNLDPSLFQGGSNIIAVEVHNNNATSTDLLWDAAITFTTTSGSTNYYATTTEIPLPSGNVSLTASYRPLSEAGKAQQGCHPVCVNEVSASNGCYINEYGKKNDWVELYNTTDEDIDVEGMYLTDNLEKQTKYRISGPNTIIPAHGYLLVWCDNLATTSRGIHAPFKLASAGGIVALTAADFSWMDVLEYTAHDANSTVGRYPDGGKQTYLMNVPTIAKSNILSSYTAKVVPTAIDKPQILASANGFRICYGAQQLLLKSDDDGVAHVAVYTTDGRQVDQAAVEVRNGSARLDVSHLASGFYIARATNSQQTQVACKFIKN